MAAVGAAAATAAAAASSPPGTQLHFLSHLPPAPSSAAVSDPRLPKQENSAAGQAPDSEVLPAGSPNAGPSSRDSSPTRFPSENPARDEPVAPNSEGGAGASGVPTEAEAVPRSLTAVLEGVSIQGEPLYTLAHAVVGCLGKIFCLKCWVYLRDGYLAS